MPRDGSATRERILAAAERLVVAKGLSGTSVDEIIAASSSSKGAFFHHFASKQALAEALTERYVAADLALLERGLEAAAATEADPVGRAIAFVRFLEDSAALLTADVGSGLVGCLYTPVLVEFDLAGEGSIAQVDKAAAQWREQYAALLHEALADRGIRGVPVDAIADHVFVTFRGAFLLARATGDAARVKEQFRALRMLLWALLR